MSTSPRTLFLHAFPLNARMWDPQLAEMRSGARGLAVDLPGFGRCPAAEPDLDRYADAAIEALDADGGGRAVVVGLSMGGYVAFRLLERHRGRVAGLVLADTRAGPDDEAARQRRTDQAARVRREGTSWLPEALLPALLGETTRRERPEVVDAVRGLVEDAEPEGVARALVAMRDRPDSTALLATISVPTLVLAGGEDTLTPPEEARAMAAAIPGARFELLPGVGHLSNLEDPLLFNAAVLPFLASIAERSPGNGVA